MKRARIPKLDANGDPVAPPKKRRRPISGARAEELLLLLMNRRDAFAKYSVTWCTLDAVVSAVSAAQDATAADGRAKRGVQADPRLVERCGERDCPRCFDPARIPRPRDPQVPSLAPGQVWRDECGHVVKVLDVGLPLAPELEKLWSGSTMTRYIMRGPKHSPDRSDERDATNVVTGALAELLNRHGYRMGTR